MKHTLISHFSKALAVGSALAALSLFVPASFAQQASQDTVLGLDHTGDLLLAEAGQVLELGDGQVIDGNVVISGFGCDIVVNPGVQTVNGNVQINGSNVHMTFGFNEKKENGQLKVEGRMELGPDNSPLLNLDLSKAFLSKGDVFTIISATEIVGEFNGMGHGDDLKLGDYALRINYNPGSVTMTVLKAPRRPHPRITPIIEFDNDLIDPTSTAPF